MNVMGKNMERIIRRRIEEVIECLMRQFNWSLYQASSPMSKGRLEACNENVQAQPIVPQRSCFASILRTLLLYDDY